MDGWRPPKDKGPTNIIGIDESKLDEPSIIGTCRPKKINDTIKLKKNEPVDSMLIRKNVENVLRALFENAEIFTATVCTGGGAGSARVNVNKKYVGQRASLIIWDCK